MQAGKSNHHPIALVGGGLATQIMAIILRHSGFDFTWFNGAPNPEIDRPDTRTTTIHQAGKIMLDTLGLWAELEDRAWPITKISVALSAPGKNRDIGGSDTNRPWPLSWTSARAPLAYVIENQALLEVFSAHNADLKPQLRTINQIRVGSPTQLEDSQQQSWTADLVIACDGPRSPLRKMAGLKHIKLDKRQAAIVTSLTTARPIGTDAYQRFLATGPLAVMPMGDHQASLVWSLPYERALGLKTLDESTFNQELSAAFGDQLGGLKRCAETLLWPLYPTYVPKIAKPGFVLAGDAAHALHPLAGMGFNLALADGAILLDCLQAAAQRGLLAGHISVTADYQSRRRVEILAMTGVTQGLDRSLSHRANPLSDLAAIGMSLLGHASLRDKLSLLAMGGKLSSASLFEGSLGIPLARKASPGDHC